eukprot:59032-Amphidinium_carterae.1
MSLAQKRPGTRTLDKNAGGDRPATRYFGAENKGTIEDKAVITGTQAQRGKGTPEPCQGPGFQRGKVRRKYVKGLSIAIEYSGTEKSRRTP